MTSNIKQLDPVQGLVDYVLDVKPFHTKIVEVLVEYVYEEALATTVGDLLELDIGIQYPATPVGELECLGAYDTLPWDSDGTYPVVAPNASIPFEQYPAINPGTNSMIFPGDVTRELKTGNTVYIFSAVEDFTNVTPIADILTSASPSLNAFTVAGNYTPFYTAGLQFVVYGTFGNDGTYTVDVAGSTFDGFDTTIPVVEPILDPLVVGSIGLIETAGPHTGYYTISNTEFSNGSIDSWAAAPDPFAIIKGDTAHTIVTFVEPVASIPALGLNQTYSAFLVNSELPIVGVLPYSNVGPTPNEGFSVEAVTGVDATLLTFTVDYDYSSSNVSIGDKLRITRSAVNNGIYTIANIASTFSPNTTTFTVVESITSDVAVDGDVVLDIGSNMFIIDGDQRSRFSQGKALDVIAGTFAGSYNVLYSDLVDGQTRIRVLEEISFGAMGSPIGSPGDYGFIQDHVLGYAEYAPMCGLIQETRLHVVFAEDLQIFVENVGSPIGSP